MYAATGGSNVKWGALISNGVAGHHWPPAGDGPVSCAGFRRNHSIIACSRHTYIYIYCCSSRTSRSWWITHSTQCHRRGCNNIPSFLQRTAPIARSLCEGWTRHNVHILVTAPLCCHPKSTSGMCTKLHTVAASNNRDHAPQSLYYCLFVPRIYIVVLRAHPVHGESHIQRNATREVATTPWSICISWSRQSASWVCSFESFPDNSKLI